MSPFPLAMLVAQAVAPVPAPPSETTAPPPVATWAALPELRYRRRMPQPDAMTSFVRAEIRAGRCAVAADAQAMPVDLILFVDTAGLVRRIVPRAIDCPTVEQYAVGVVLRMTRDNLIPIDGMADGWYRTRIVFPVK